MKKLGRERDLTIDCMKGFAIVLMVIGHSGFEWTPFIYLFHMALFFMISGYLWNDKNVSSAANVKKYVRRKIKTLWLPFVLWNQLMLLCNNLFLKLGIYADRGIAAKGAEAVTVHGYMQLRDMIKPFVKMFFFRTDLELGGATWFLAALFIVSIMHMVIRLIATHWKYGKWFFGMTCVGTAVFCQLLCTDLRIPMNLMIKRAIFSYFPFLIGYFFQKLAKKESPLPVQILLFLGAVALLLTGYGAGWSNQIGTASADNLFICAVLTISGWYLCRMPALWCPESVKKYIAYIGQHTLSIVLGHFLAFKAVSYLYVVGIDKPMELVGSFPVIAGDVPQWLWLAYTAAGLGLPLLLGSIFGLCKDRLQSLFCQDRKLQDNCHT